MKQPEIQERLSHIAEGRQIFQDVRLLLEKAGERQGKMLRFRGKTLFMESDDQSMWVKRDDKTIFHASGERKHRGILQTHRVEITEGNRQKIHQEAERMRARVRQQQQRQSWSRGLSR